MTSFAEDDVGVRVVLFLFWSSVVICLLIAHDVSRCFLYLIPGEEFYGVLPALRNVFTVALTAAHSAHSAQTSFRAPHPCVAAASFLPCARPPDGAYRLAYQGQLPRTMTIFLICAALWRPPWCARTIPRSRRDRDAR